MTACTRLEIGLVIFLVAMFLIPCALIIFVSAESPYYLVSGEPVREAALAKGITVLSARDVTWNLPGAIGGKTYVLSDSAGTTVTVSTQSFDSAGSRDAAVRLYHSYTVGRGRSVGSLVVVGQHLVYVTPADSGILQQIAPLLTQNASP